MVKTADFRVSKPFRLHLTLAHEKRGAKPVAALLTETLGAGMILDVPRDFCSQGELLVVEIRTEGLEQDLALQIHAKVSRQTLDAHHHGDHETVELAFEKWSVEDWSRLCHVYAERQAEVERAFEALKR